MDHHISNKKLLVQSTKKVGCSATVLLTEVATFPQHRVSICVLYFVVAIFFFWEKLVIIILLQVDDF